MTVGERQLRVGLLLPENHDGHSSLPVLMDPYGGPDFQRVMQHRARWNESQWLADQGFAVIVADGRGTPGRGLGWARAVSRDLAGPVLEDQVDALHGVAARTIPGFERVAIRGWSFGGYLAALAASAAPTSSTLLSPAHLSPSGACTTRTTPSATSGSILTALTATRMPARRCCRKREELSRPLLIIHGLADDNVVVANTLQLSQRLTEAGRLHSVLPLSGITHMTPQEAVAEHLVTVQLDFIRQALGIAVSS